ncbi:LolA-like protein [Cellulomonas gilvus]|uniref:Lipoprotein n=1 Tax=Cellulomonas gilvus (strain ATCC 13127 / NRRL B-14078) TaxID=593907 RepID=F8A762_CELGA|nr:hypothetical protein [Cellulomonas gilvus]AEI13549.1 hypothetical protein Celgi_3057 [Cellulomonas gilvus ATCC 13127]
MRAIHRIVSAGAAAALALTLTACGGSDDTTPDDAPSSGGAVATEPADDETSEAPEPSGDELTAENFADVLAASVADGVSYRMTMEMTSDNADVSSTSEAEVEMLDGSPAMRMTSTSMGIETETILLDGVYYMNLGEMTGGKFLKIDASDPDNPFAESVQGLDDAADPAKSIEAFKDSIESLEKVGEEDVDGVPTTHYRLVVDSSAMSEQLAGLTGGEGTAPSLPATFDYDIWVDGDNRLAKMETEVMGSTVVTTYSDWNDSSIKVTAPSADEITTEDPFASLGGS